MDMSITKLKRFGALIVGVAAAQMGARPVCAIMPVNSERPLAEQTCAEAKRRVEEAKLGSPLLSAQENAERLRQAMQLMERLCRDENGAR